MHNQPPQPLNELEQLRKENERLREVARLARIYATNSTPVNLMALDKALKTVEEK